MRVAIVGGSLGGLFAGVLLHRAGHEVRLYERSRAGLEGRGAGLVIQRDVSTVLRAVGRDDIARTGVVARERVTLDRDGRIVDRQATPQMQVSWDILYRTFRDLLPDDAYHVGEAVVEVGQNAHGAWLRTAADQRMEADVLIGADGIGSLVRSMVDPGAGAPRYAGYVAWRGLVPETTLPSEAAVLLERFSFFNAPGAHALGYLVPGPNGEVAVGERRYNWVWYRTAPSLTPVLTGRSGVERSYSLGQGQVPDRVVDDLRRSASAELPTPFRAAVLAEAQPFVQAIFDLVPSRMVNGRMVLVGDAASVARPHTAMGVASAAADAITLVQALEESSLRPALAAYDAARLDAHRDIVNYGRHLGASLEIASSRSFEDREATRG